MSIASEGQATCEKSTTGVQGCIFSEPCSAYSKIWDYSFKVRFTDSLKEDQYLVLPLATIASDVLVEGRRYSVCKIYVSEL